MNTTVPVEQLFQLGPSCKKPIIRLRQEQRRERDRERERERDRERERERERVKAVESSTIADH